MRRTAPIYLLAAAILALAAPTSSAAPAPAAAAAAKPAALTGTVTLSGSSAGYAPLTVLKRLVLPDPFITTQRSAISVTGGGRMSGFALVKDGLGNGIIGGRSAYTNEYTDKAAVFVLGIGPEADYEAGDNGGFVVEPGSYRLYLITDGKPTTVRLAFRGGTGGTLALKPTVKTKEVVQVSGASPGTGPGVHTAGFDTPAGPSVHFSVAAFKTDAHAESVLSKCFFLRKPSGSNPYLPGCPSTAGDSGLQTVQPVSDENPNESTYYFTYFALIPRAGHYASGVNYSSVSLLTESHYAHYFLDLNAPAPAKAAPVKPVSAAPAPAPAPGGQPPAAAPGSATVDTLPSTGPGPAAALGPAMLLAAAAARRARSQQMSDS